MTFTYSFKITDFKTNPLPILEVFREVIRDTIGIYIIDCYSTLDDIDLTFERQLSEEERTLLLTLFHTYEGDSKENENGQYELNTSGYKTLGNFISQTFSDSTSPNVDKFNLAISESLKDLSHTHTEMVGITGSQALVFSSDSLNVGKTIFGISKSSDKGSSWEPCLVVTQNQKVGIGTNAPTDSLTVSGVVSASNFVTSDGVVDVVSHVGDSNIHHPINDMGVSSTELWSSEKTAHAIANGSGHKLFDYFYQLDYPTEQTVLSSYYGNETLDISTSSLDSGDYYFWYSGNVKNSEEAKILTYRIVASSGTTAPNEDSDLEEQELEIFTEANVDFKLMKNKFKTFSGFVKRRVGSTKKLISLQLKSDGGNVVLEHICLGVSRIM